MENTFNNLGLNDTILEGLEAMNFSTPTPIQQQIIPSIISGKDVIACAQTGTGKTAAFLLPVMHKLSELTHLEGIKALIIAPTRELAIQIDMQLEGFSYYTNLSSLAVYGGTDAKRFDEEMNALKMGADIIVGTPGKLFSHFNLGYVNTKNLQFLVLDEADRMLDMGFYEDIMRLANYLPKERQTLMFSATMPSKIRTLAKQILNEPTELNIALSKPSEKIIQAAYLVHDENKIDLCEKLLSDKSFLSSAIIFSSKKQTVKQLELRLKKLGFKTGSIHSDLEQKEREEVLWQFKNKKIQLLVATDIVARGIDIDSLDLVVNFDVPPDPEDYIHRIGRTARAEKEGVAITLINGMDVSKFNRIEKLMELEVYKSPLPEGIPPGPEYIVKSGGGNRGGFKGRGKGNYRGKKA
ncbi:MAG: DEAD/DEAH box helicase [Luteibaculaceae bacterium]